MIRHIDQVRPSHQLTGRSFSRYNTQIGQESSSDRVEEHPRARGGGPSCLAPRLARVAKSETYDLLGQAIRECWAGRRYLSPIGRRVLLKSPYVRELLATLSSRELNVYKLLGQGVSTAEIAARMELSPRTVESYYARIQIKLGLNGMKELRNQAAAKPV